MIRTLLGVFLITACGSSPIATDPAPRLTSSASPQRAHTPQIANLRRVCFPGDVAYQKCNSCTCVANNSEPKIGHWDRCTLKGCDFNINYNQYPDEAFYSPSAPVCDCAKACDCYGVDDPARHREKAKASRTCQLQNIVCECGPCMAP